MAADRASGPWMKSDTGSCQLDPAGLSAYVRFMVARSDEKKRETGMAAARAARLKKALKANITRRKAQAKARNATSRSDDEQQG